MKTSKFSKKLKSVARRSGPRYIDLHIHSRFSDGDYDTKQIIDFSLSKGISAIAITDHDAIEAFNEGREYAEEKKLEFIPGMELSSYKAGSEIHILGYLFEPTNLKLNMKLMELQKKRVVRAKNIVQKLNQSGIEINVDRVLEKAEGTSVGRPHIATVMLEEEYVSTFQEAFEKFLASEFILEFETNRLPPEEAIDIILQAGGVPVLAHPAKSNCDSLIPQLVEAGIKGIETYCNNVEKSDIVKYRNIAKQYNLICCGGSDFHNERAGIKGGIGSVKVPYSSLNLLKKAKECL